jgi:hypothetical protein
MAFQDLDMPFAGFAPKSAALSARKLETFQECFDLGTRAFKAASFR